MSKWENTVPGIKFSQWLKGKTLSCNIVSCLRFSALIIIHLVFTIFVLKALYKQKRLCEIKFLSKLSPRRCNFSNNLLNFPAVMNYLQMSPRQWFLFLSHTGEAEQIYTHKGPFDKSMFLHKAFSGKSTPHYFIMKMLLKNISSVLQQQYLLTIVCSAFSFVSVGSQNCSLVWYTSTHRVAFSTPVFCSCLFLVEHTWRRILL
jgi:hypothetical protein